MFLALKIAITKPPKERDSDELKNKQINQPFLKTFLL